MQLSSSAFRGERIERLEALHNFIALVLCKCESMASRLSPRQVGGGQDKGRAPAKVGPRTSKHVEYAVHCFTITVTSAGARYLLACRPPHADHTN